ncbi:MAG TPA: hypothetical protein VMQ76_11195 [Terracidiphilus sp.]|nr:hypothetical protein [Terracidiphilus sp.]
MKPLCVDLYAGLGGWSDGFLSEGFDCIGFDIERHDYGAGGYPGQLVLQDVLTLHGSQFRGAACIVASPPCQRYSYMAMPWGEAKREIAWQEWERDSPFGDFHLNDLFEACFRIQREASAAAGRWIPMVVENVKGAQRWVGRAAWHHGSFYLWGDVPALMPFTAHRKGGDPVGPAAGNGTGATSWFFKSRADPRDMRRNEDGDFVRMGIKQGGSGAAWFDKALDERRKAAGGTKAGGDWFGTYAEEKAAGTISPCRLHGSRSNARKAASAQIAKIPFPLSSWVARCFLPCNATVSVLE